MAFDIELAEFIGKSTPNEIAKMSSVLKFIPGIGQALQVAGAADASATTYSDVYEREKEAGASGTQARAKAVIPTVQQGISGFHMGTNPGMYGSTGPVDRNWADYAGMIGNLYGSFGGGAQGLGGQVNPQGAISNIGQISGQQGTPSTGGMGSMGGLGNLAGLAGGEQTKGQDNREMLMELYLEQQKKEKERKEKEQKKKVEELEEALKELLNQTGTFSTGNLNQTGGQLPMHQPMPMLPAMSNPVSYGI